MLRKWTPIVALVLFGLAANTGTRSLTRGEGKRFLTDRESPVNLSLPEEDEAFSFAIFGDRTGGPAEGVKILAEAVDDVNAIGPDLVMTVGDLINGYNTTAPWLAQMREFKGIMSGLECEWFPVAGNHDTYWRGEDRPLGEHDANYEEHFGPLWYAFRHKTSWFIVLYSDEGNPETGEKNFHKPDCQRISEEQFAWLDDTLKRTVEAEHVFVFIHHPRWKGGQYGDDWQRVHERFVESGNVSAVFAGHIHAMTYDGVRDGIEYFTLASVGAFLDEDLPDAGYLHHFDLVTVRESGIDIASIPVGEVTDPRTLTTEIARDAKRAYEELVHEARGGFEPYREDTEWQRIEFELRNPSRADLELTLAMDGGDPRLRVRPDHVHQLLKARATVKLEFEIRRGTGSLIDEAFRLPELVVSADYLGDGIRIALPPRRLRIPTDSKGLLPPAIPESERWIALDGTEDCAVVPSSSFELPDGPFTLECWAWFDGFEPRQGLLAKTENSEYGIFVGGGKPAFFAHLDGRYRTAEGEASSLPTEEWVHLAGVFDGSEVRLYVNGALVGAGKAGGSRKPNRFPLVLGGDVDGQGQPGSLHRGRLDEVRLSKVARYSGEQFSPERRNETDAETVLLYHMDATCGPWLHDSSGSEAHAERRGHVRVEGE